MVTDREQQKEDMIFAMKMTGVIVIMGLGLVASILGLVCIMEVWII